MVSYSIQVTKKTQYSTIMESELEKKLQLQEKVIQEKWQVQKLEEQLQEKWQVQKLEEQLQEIKLQVSEIESKMGDGQEQTKGILRELEEVRMRAGLIPVKGPGLIVTLNDSSRAPDSGNVNDYIVHEENIRKVVNELYSAGAEAISINGQRLTSISAIRCVGPTVLVNEVKTVPPFEISAIGQSDTLYTALNMPGGVVQEITNFSNIELKIDQKERVDIPAYAGDSKEHLDMREVRS